MKVILSPSFPVGNEYVLVKGYALFFILLIILEFTGIYSSIYILVFAYNPTLTLGRYILPSQYENVSFQLKFSSYPSEPKKCRFLEFIS